MENNSLRTILTRDSGGDELNTMQEGNGSFALSVNTNTQGHDCATRPKDGEQK